MFERFTRPARQVVVLAQRMATTEIGREQLLDGLLLEEHGIAARVLRELGRPRPAFPVREGVGQIPFTTEAHDALRCAARIADELGHALVGTEHLLIAAAPELRPTVLQYLSGGEPLDS